MARINLHNEDGFTIIELMVSLTIVSIVLGLASTVFLFLNTQLVNWQANLQFYNNFQVVQTKIYRDILGAESMVLTDTSVVLRDLDFTENYYVWPEGILQINKKKIVDRNVDTLTLSIKELSEKDKTISWSIFLKNEHRLFKQNYILSTRKPIRWTPIGNPVSRDN